MRLALFLAFALLAPTVLAEADDEECGFETHQHMEQVLYFWVGYYVETRDCPEGESYTVALNDPDGRTEVQWYDAEHGVGLEVFRFPRFVSWTDTDRGCWLVVYTFGATEMECGALGPPPSPRDTLP